MERYKELHPEFSFEIHVLDTADGSYHAALDAALASGGEVMPDIYTTESSFAKKYIDGTMALYAAPYKDLGIDVDTLLKEADIYQYAIDMGTNADGQLVALCYEGTGSVFIYRRSIARDVWGTDDPDIIKDKIGPGWDRFLEAAADLKVKGYSILSSYEDVWQPVENSAGHPWVVGGRLVIDAEREAFLDLAKTLHDNRYTNGTQSWSLDWYNDMRDEGPSKVFGYFGPSWMVNDVI